VTSRLCALLWARPGCEGALAGYEDQVLAVLVDCGGRVLQRLRSDGTDDAPCEVHVVEFTSRRDFDAYLADPRRAALADRRDAVVARTQVFAVSPV